MMQAQGIMIRENMRTIGAQVYEQVVRSAYAKRNSSVNDSGISRIVVILIKGSLSIGNRVDLKHSCLKELIYAGKCRVGTLINWLRFLFFIYKNVYCI